MQHLESTQGMEKLSIDLPRREDTSDIFKQEQQSRRGFGRPRRKGPCAGSALPRGGSHSALAAVSASLITETNSETALPARERPQTGPVGV